MKKLIMKLLGLDSFLTAVNLSSEILRNQNEELKKKLEELEEVVADLETKVEGLEEFDSSKYVSEDEVNDRIESYLNDNEYVSSSYVDDEIESKVSEKVEEAVEELDLEDKVKEVVDDMDKASFGDTQELESIVRKEVKSFMLNSVKIDFVVR